MIQTKGSQGGIVSPTVHDLKEEKGSLMSSSEEQLRYFNSALRTCHPKPLNLNPRVRGSLGFPVSSGTPLII